MNSRNTNTNTQRGNTMSFSNWIMGNKIEKAQRCRWCSKRPVSTDCAPIPLCGECFASTREYCRPVPVCNDCVNDCVRRRVDIPDECRHHAKNWPGNLRDKMFDQFPREFTKYARHSAAKMTRVDVAQGHMAAAQDIGEMRVKANRLDAMGKSQEAQALREEADAKQKLVFESKATMPMLMLELEREDS